MKANYKKAIIFDHRKEPVCEAKVTLSDEEVIVLSFDPDYMDHLTSEMDITFYDEAKGLITCRCLLSNPKRYLERDNLYVQTLDCVIGEELSVLQRREDLKVPVNLSVQVMIPQGFELPPEAQTEQRFGKALLPGIAKNLSAGGIYFECEVAFPINQEVQFYLSIPGKQTLLLHAIMLRIDAIEATEETAAGFGYGCRFMNLPAASETILRSYVFQQQMPRRHR